MQNIFNPDFQDFIRSLNEADVKYILVGGYAVILHGYHRNTGDLDIWVERSAENYHKLVRAFQLFGMPVFDMTLSNFLDNTDLDVFTFGRPPVKSILYLVS
jgi:predicted nucleotidyltransferase